MGLESLASPEVGLNIDAATRSHASPTGHAEVGAPRAAERVPMARILAHAFRDNPLNVAVIRGDEARRLRSNRSGMKLLLHTEAGRATLRVARESGRGSHRAVAGGLIALEPLAYPLPPPPLVHQLRAAVGQGLGAARRWGRVFGELEQLHPKVPHWYLSVLGVEPSQQGRGIGSTLLRDWLGQVDGDEMPAYLETDRRENVAFYARWGFEVRDSKRVLGVPIWTMWREAREGR